MILAIKHGDGSVSQYDLSSVEVSEETGEITFRCHDAYRERLEVSVDSARDRGLRVTMSR